MTIPFRLPSFSISFWIGAFSEVCVRFPAPMLCAAVFTGTFISLIYQGGDDNQQVAVLMAALLGLPLSIGLTALAERLGWSGPKNYALQGIGLLLALGIYFTLEPLRADWDDVQIPRYLLLIVVAHLWVSLAPYLHRAGSVSDFWEYNKRLLIHFATAAVYSAILFVGVVLAIAAVNALFELNWSGKEYSYWFAIASGMFQTTIFLYYFPKKTVFADEEEVEYPDLLRNLCQYVFVPIVGLYFLILYAYSAKILLTWALPRGWVSSLVLGFSVAGIFTYLINYRLAGQPGVSRWVLLYQHFFWWVMAPMVILLFVAISRRILDYGVTPERFFVAHAGVWLLVMCIYFMVSKAKDIRLIPLSLALFIAPTLAGPMSAFSISQRSQIGVLKSIFEKNEAFTHGHLKRDLSYLPEEDKERVRSIVSFLQRQNALYKLSDWLTEPLDSIATDYPNNLSHALLNYWNIKGDRSSGQILYIRTNRSEKVIGLDVAGFRQIYEIDAHEPLKLEQTKKPPYLGLSDTRKELVVRLSASQPTTDTLALGSHLLRWQSFGPQTDGVLPDSLASSEWKTPNRTYRLFVAEVLFERESLQIQQMKGILLVK